VTFPTDDQDEDLPGSTRDNAKRALSDEAAEWFIRLRDDRLNVRHRERNVHWLKESPSHIAELLRIQQVYTVLRAAKLESRPPGSPGRADSNVVELTPRRLPPQPPVRSDQSRVRSTVTWKVAAAVACLAVSLLLGFMVKAVWLDRTLETELGEWRIATLTDGTVVRLGPASRLRVSFGDDHRSVRLLKGEARFDVAKDPSRPFFVQSKLVGVLAVGTEFRVSQYGGEDVVAVTEGTVAVYRDGRDGVHGAVTQPAAQLADATGGVALTAGEQVAVSEANQSQPLAKQKINLNYEMAWADGWVSYEDKTIAEVASDFNRRNRVQIVIVDASVAERRLAFFRGSATDPESFVSALAVSSDITIVRDDPDVLRVELAPQLQPPSLPSNGPI